MGPSQQVRENVARFDSINLRCSFATRRDSRRRITDKNRAAAAERKLVINGDVSGALRILCSTETVASSDDACLVEEMRSKHPTADAEDALPDFPSSYAVPPSCNADNVLLALRSFRKGTAGGLDNITAQHLLDAIAAGTETALPIREALAGVCNIIIRGAAPIEIRDSLFGSWLIAARKPAGGHRPIAIGSTLRRLATKILLRRLRSASATLLSPLQLGYGTPNGAEVMVHTVRSYVENAEAACVIKIDFHNAFNSHRRGPMLQETLRKMPKLFPLAHYAYSRPLPIFFGDQVIPSEAGCQQGDVAAPLLFSLLLHPLLSKLRSRVKVAYLDDLVICDCNVDNLMTDLQVVAGAAATLGLRVNGDKCDIFLKEMCPAEIMPILSSALPGAKLVKSDEISLLGAALFPEGVPNLVGSKLKEFRRLHTRLQYMSSHSGGYLLMHALGVQKVIYLLRCSPAFKASQSLRELDAQLQLTAGSTLKLQLSPEGIEQFYLPIKFGGHGIRLSSTLAMPCFLSSTFACCDGVRTILEDSDASIAYQTEALNAWRETNDAAPEAEKRSVQREWDQISILKSHSQLQANLDGLDSVRLASVSRGDSGLWLHALPSKNLGTLLSDDEYRVACALRYGSVLFDEHRCLCGEMVDPAGLHLLSCNQGSAARDARHNEVNDLLVRALRQAKVSVRPEPANLSDVDGIRPVLHMGRHDQRHLRCKLQDDLSNTRSRCSQS